MKIITCPRCRREIEEDEASTVFEGEHAGELLCIDCAEVLDPTCLLCLGGIPPAEALQIGGESYHRSCWRLYQERQQTRMRQ